MKTRTTFFFLLTILCFALRTASADQTLFTSGPINGNVNAYIIDGPGGQFGVEISDEFIATLSGNATTLNFGEWTTAGFPTTIQWSIGTTSFGGTLSGPTDVTSTFVGINDLGYPVYNTQVSISFPLTAGTAYYLTLSGANDSAGTQIDAWDDNESPNASCYFEDPYGSGPCPTSESESFTISGQGGATPEPSSILLFGSGFLGLAGVLRRKLHF